MTVPSNRVSLFVSGLLFCGFSVASCSSTERQSGTAGAPGIGDTLFPTRGNGGYDVATYDISLEWRPRPDVIVATETITASATQALSAFNLDLHGLTVTSVTVNKRDATFSRDGDELTITPARALANASKFTTVIAYNGTPEPQDGEGWYHDGNGGVVVFGQPGGASVWHPVNDHPLDKAGYSVHITAPSNMNAAANGTLTETVDNGATKTWTFEQPFPAAPYLQMLAIGDYTIVEGGASKSGIRVRNVFPTDKMDELTKQFAKQPAMIDAFEKAFGPYPFDVYGAFVMNDLPLSNALETQTLSTFASDTTDEQVQAHELAHQWFGDSLAIASWSDLWLNEGFATYSEFLWQESQDSAFDTTGAITEQANDPDIVAQINRPPTQLGTSIDELFTASVYVRGSMLLHALRLEIGSDTFHRLLSTYADRFKGANVSTKDFIAIAEEVSGQQLDALFERWLNDKTLPDDFRR